jgi:hypothetical protein
MESIFLILSGVILAAGVLYWMWSHIQLTQKKVQLLENAVFELRGMLTAPPAPSGPPAPAGPSELEGQEPVYNDLEEEEEWSSAPEGSGSTSLDALQEQEELQPGGGAGQGIEHVEEEAPISNEQFRELFIQRTGSAASPKEASAPATTSEALEAMPVKELRRLAEQRGITGVSELKKKELLSALRQQIQPATSAAAESVVVERTLDLTEVVEEEVPVLE